MSVADHMRLLVVERFADFKRLLCLLRCLHSERAGSVVDDLFAAGEQARIGAVSGKQFGVCADLDDTPMFHHDYAIGIADGGQPMRDDQHGAIAA